MLNENNSVFENNRANINNAMDAKKVLPRTIYRGLQDKNLPKRPANPKRKTAIWICITPLFNIDGFNLNKLPWNRGH